MEKPIERSGTNDEKSQVDRSVCHGGPGYES